MLESKKKGEILERNGPKRESQILWVNSDQISNHWSMKQTQSNQAKERSNELGSVAPQRAALQFGSA